MDTFGLQLYTMTRIIYIKSRKCYLCDATEIPHILSNTLFTHSSSPSCSLMNCIIWDVHASSSLQNNCTARTYDLQSVIMFFASVILSMHPLSMASVFTFLCGTLSVLLPLTRRVLISGKDNELPRKSSMAGMVDSGSGSTVFDDDATGWSGGIHITTPVRQTTIQLDVDDAHNASYSLPFCIQHLCLLPPLDPPQ